MIHNKIILDETKKFGNHSYTASCECGWVSEITFHSSNGVAESRQEWLDHIAAVEASK